MADQNSLAASPAATPTSNEPLSLAVTPPATGRLAPGQGEDGLITKPDPAVTPDGSPVTPPDTSDDKKPDTEQKLPKAEESTRRESVEAVLEASGVSLSAIETEYVDKGGLSDESYAKLEQAGFSRAIVDTYIAGLHSEAYKANAMVAQEVANIQALAGGSDGYAKMTEWAAANLTQEEVDGFNAITATNNPTAIKLAVSSLHSRYQDAVGSDPKLIHGSGAAPSARDDNFQSWDEVTRAMADPRYRADPAYNAAVAAKLARSTMR